MAAAAILSVVFNSCNMCGSYIQAYMDVEYRWAIGDGDDHNTFAVVVIMTE